MAWCFSWGSDSNLIIFVLVLASSKIKDDFGEELPKFIVFLSERNEINREIDTSEDTNINTTNKL